MPEPIRVTPSESTALAPVPTPAQRQVSPGVATPSFEAHLAAVGERRQHEDIQRLYRSVEEAGRLLRKQANERTFEQYRRSVHNFLQAALPRAFRLKTHVSHRELSVLVEEVDAELASLTRALMSGQQDALALATRIDHINGILLDLLV
ncbi:MAG: hypothetical protein CL878_11250 [Dehalococcoidia bacterium]|nr:hypothetical protein [Dehalococcoidia bacterium]